MDVARSNSLTNDALYERILCSTMWSMPHQWIPGSATRLLPARCATSSRNDDYVPEQTYKHESPSLRGERDGQPLRHDNVLQLNVVGQAISEWRISFANDERRQIAAGRLGDPEAVGLIKSGGNSFS